MILSLQYLFIFLRDKMRSTHEKKPGLDKQMNLFEWLANSIISLFFALWPRRRPRAEILKNAKIVAHRGVHENGLAPENSLKAFDLATKNNLWGIEFDVRMTADHVAVVQHDPLPPLTFAELSQQQPHLPKLEAIVQKFGGRLHFMIEIKDDFSTSPESVQALKNELSCLTPGQDYHLISLRPEYLEPLSFAPKSAYIDIIWLNPRDIFSANHKLGHGGLAGHFIFISDQQINELHRLGRKVGVGYPNSKFSLYRELNRNVDYIFTNHPLRLKKHLDPLPSKR